MLIAGFMDIMSNNKLIKWFSGVGKDDAATVGGKGASLGEMHRNLSSTGIRMPNGFNVTTDAYSIFVNCEVPESTWGNVAEPEGTEEVRKAALSCNTLSAALAAVLEDVDVNDHLDLHGRALLARAIFRQTPVPEIIRQAIIESYSKARSIKVSRPKFQTSF